MANQNQFPHVLGSSSPFPPPPQGMPYPSQDEIYPPYAWAAGFPGGFALPPGPNYDDNPAWVRFRHAMSHPPTTPLVPEAARKRTNEVLARLSEERKELMSRFPPFTPSSVGSHYQRQPSTGGFSTPLPRGMEAAAIPRGHQQSVRAPAGPPLNVIHEEEAQHPQAQRDAPSFGGSRFGMDAEARSPEERAVAARRNSNSFKTISPQRRSTIDNFLARNRCSRRSLSADGRIADDHQAESYEDKENNWRVNNSAESYHHRQSQLDQTAAFGPTEDDRRGDRRSAEGVCQHIGPWPGVVPPRPARPEDIHAPERMRKAGRARREKAKTAESYKPPRPQEQEHHQSSQMSTDSAFQSLVEEAEAAATQVADHHERRRPERHLHHHDRHPDRGHREGRRKGEIGVPRRGGSASSMDDWELNPQDDHEATYDDPAAAEGRGGYSINTSLSLADLEAREIERTERRRYSEAAGRADPAELLRTGPVGGHRIPRGGSFEDSNETARHLSFDDPSFDAMPDEPDFAVDMNGDQQHEEDSVSDIPPHHEVQQHHSHRPSETISFGGSRQRRQERNKMVDTSLQVGPELRSPVPAPSRRKTRSRRNRDPESSDGTLEEEFGDPKYGRGAPRSTRRPPLDVMKGERVIYKRTKSGNDLMIGVLARHKHAKDGQGSSSQSRRSSNDRLSARERSRRNRASQESYDPNETASPVRLPLADELSGQGSDKSPAPGRKKGSAGAGEKRGKKKASSRARQPQPKAKSRAARKKTGVINAKKGAQKVVAAKASKKADEVKRPGKKSRDTRKDAEASEVMQVVAHARREGGPSCAYYFPGDEAWRSDGTDSEIPAHHKLVGYSEDRMLKTFGTFKCVVQLDSQHYMPVIFQLLPFQQKLPETVSEGKSAFLVVLECGDGGDELVDEHPVMLRYENKERPLGTGDSFIVRAGITYSLENEHRRKDAKILMVLRQDTSEDSGLNSEIEV
ncbi:hypothetical protein FOZ61_006425 [Perkinsus olseni]|uniref:Uncharacterized protein n=1 Tax=Perkinsus olseni TaxID=32597 RepID=A0A7J6LD88_PEROL|nr:hypothetical protein FOZ61_006425 [Perkinsus olseni]KAF4660908.1 hypothetical protein FOL46_005944 [Perkinsus olseni]